MEVKIMQDEQQFEQLMLQYNQLKNGSLEIRRMIDNEDFDNALTMIKSREEIFLSCKCMRRYLELTPNQQEELDSLLEELRALELSNIKLLSENRLKVQQELKTSQQNEKLQQAYDFNEHSKGNILNIKE